MSFLHADLKIAPELPPQTSADKTGGDIQFFVVAGVIASILALFGYLIKTDVPSAVPPSDAPPVASPLSDVPPAAAPPSIEAPASAPILPDHPAGSALSPRSDSVPLPRPRPTKKAPR
jgi:hypothetical protein